MNKSIALAILLGLGSYSCHAKTLEEIEVELNRATTLKAPGYYADALADLKAYPDLDPSGKKQVLEDVNSEIGPPPFCVLWHKTLEEIYTLVDAQMSLISAARARNLNTYKTIVMLGFGDLKFLTGEELTETTYYVQSHYWPAAPTLLDIALDWDNFLRKLLAE